MSFYTPLDHSENEIRLLRVDLSDLAQHEVISKVALRSKKQQYQALSYTWGDQRSQTTITINEQDFQVSLSLNEALKSVRAFWKETYSSEGKPLLLWVDQICINQSSIEEKSNQVAYMNEIYRRAEQVLIWLPVPASVSSGFDNWSMWKSWHESQVTAVVSDLKAAYTSPQPMEYTSGQRSSQSLIRAWENVRNIVESPWWSRAWIYQEFLLATRATFLIAGLAAPWVEVQEVLACFADHAQANADALSAAVIDVGQKAEQLDSNAAKRLRGQNDDIEKANGVEHDDWAAYCRSWHIHLGNILTLDPLRDGSLFQWIYNNTCGPNRRESERGKIAHIIASSFLVVLWGPFALAEYLVLVIVTPFAWACTLWPETLGKEEEFAKRRDDLFQQAAEEVDKSRKDATEMRRLAKDRLAPHETTLSLVPRSWITAQSILSSKEQMEEGTLAPLSQLIRHARNCQCEDQRDKIFAFLGVAPPSYDIAVNYDRSNTIHDVVTNATAAVITTEGTLNILNDAKEDGEVSRAIDHLPSWVPNFTTPDRRNTEYQKFIKGIQLPTSGLSASKNAPASTTFHADRNGNPERVLRARGIRVGRLAHIVQDPVHEPWRLFEDEDGRKIGTRNDARPGDEIWVLLGADVPFTLTKPSDQDEGYQILGQAMIWEDEKPSPIMYGSLIDRSDDGKVASEEIALI